MLQPFFQLVNKEIYRFMSIWLQTIVGPVSTAVLYQLIFGHQLANLSTGIPGIKYATFLIPGLVMMQILQNAFANSSSSLIQSKYMGNIIFVLMAPISPFAIYSAYLIGSILRGLVVGIAVILGIGWFGLTIPLAPFTLVYFLIMGCVVAGGLGTVAGVLCNKFDQLSGFQSFVIVPLVYLAGVFVSIETLPEVWRYIAYIDPFLYIIDGFRYGFILSSSTNIQFGAWFVLFLAIIINFLGYLLVKSGIKIKQ